MIKLRKRLHIIKGDVKMVTFIVSIILLVIGYFTYGKYIDKMFGTKQDRPTPAYNQRDNVDYLPMKTSSNSLIQLLNIAGVGPIFGPIMGHYMDL